jgi:hypothetical protein
MNYFTSNVTIDQQASTVKRLEKQIQELNEQINQMEARLDWVAVNGYGSPGSVLSDRNNIKKMKNEIIHAQAQLIEALGPAVDSDGRLEKRLKEEEEELCKLEKNLHFLNYAAPVSGTVFQVAEDRVKKKVHEIIHTQAQLIEARRPPDAPQNDRVDNSTCCICHESKNRHELFALVPCGHRCVCGVCASLMMNKPCPLCRTETTMAIRVFD